MSLTIKVKRDGILIEAMRFVSYHHIKAAWRPAIESLGLRAFYGEFPLLIDSDNVNDIRSDLQNIEDSVGKDVSDGVQMLLRVINEAANWKRGSWEIIIL